MTTADAARVYVKERGSHRGAFTCAGLNNNITPIPGREVPGLVYLPLRTAFVGVEGPGVAVILGSRVSTLLRTTMCMRPSGSPLMSGVRRGI